MADIIEELGGEAGEGIVSSILSSINSKAKEIVTKGFDYTLLVGLLLLQYMRCEPASAAEVVASVNDGTFDTTSTASIYSCDMVQNEMIISTEIIAAAIFALAYGILAALFLLLHAQFKFKNLDKVETKIESIYEWTDKIFIIDSILEIPISFLFAPLVTIFLWGVYVAFLAGLYFVAQSYAFKVQDSQAETVFNTNCCLVGYSLYKLTGEMSQYWVLYKAASSKEAKNMMKKLDAKKSGSQSSKLGVGGGASSKEESFKDNI